MKRLARLHFILAGFMLLSGSVEAQELRSDRDNLKDIVRQVLVSMTKHDPSTLPMAMKYKLTVNNGPSGLSMAAPWRTVTAFRELGPGQYVIDTPKQEVFFMATVMEESLPSIIFGRLKVKDSKLTEIELYHGRSMADSGMQFDPEGLASLPAVWGPVSESKRTSRNELTRVAKAVFDLSYGELKVSQDCWLVENGKKVVAKTSLEEFLQAFPTASKETIEKVKQAAADGNEVKIGCDRIDPPEDKNARILVDEEQSTVVTLAIVPGKVFANFQPAPDVNPEFPTVFVPDSMRADQADRFQDIGKLTYSKVPVSEPMSGVLATFEVTRFYDGKIQGTHRLMQLQSVGSVSPWVTN